jgi:peptidoglycan hydrolase-like protein with peptidoglycan-binding domain
MPASTVGSGRSRAVAVTILLTGGLLFAGSPVASAHSSRSAAVKMSAAAAKRPVIKYDSRGWAVKYVQTRLGVRPKSGWFGPITRAAVKRYQRSQGIPATGVVARLTWGALLDGGSSRPSSRASRSAPRGTSGLDWAALARCESSGNPRVVSSSGRYFGLYQFDLPTWRSVGGTGVPNQASAAEQTYRAQLLYSQRGRQPWPYCGRYL